MRKTLCCHLKCIFEFFFCYFREYYLLVCGCQRFSNIHVETDGRDCHRLNELLIFRQQCNSIKCKIVSILLGIKFFEINSVIVMA